jgi:hypothetical protein
MAATKPNSTLIARIRAAASERGKSDESGAVIPRRAPGLDALQGD